MAMSLSKVVVAVVTLSMVHTVCTADKFKYIQNDQIKLGIDLSRGGAIGYLSAVVNGGNVINNADNGRLVQLSYYGGPKPYDGCTWSGQQWSWNPIGGGDAYGHSGKIESMVDLPGGGLRIVTRPLQWACDNVQCNCQFERTITLDGTAVWVNATIRNDRTDHTDYGRYPQELPAAYSAGFLTRLTCYNGTKPWTNAPLQNWDHPGFGPWTPGHISCTEHWAAYTDPSTSFTMAVFRPGWPLFYCGYAPSNNPAEATGYIAGDGCGKGVDLTWDAEFTYQFALVIGNLDDVRAKIYTYKDMVNTECSGWGDTASLLPGAVLTPPPHASLRT